FQLRDGFVETGLMKLAARGSEFGITGRTGLDGTLDHTIDVRALLAGHADGAKILEYLGDTEVAVKLTGSLDAPRLAMPDLQQIGQEALRSTLEGEARERIEKEAGQLLERILGGRKQGGEQGGEQGAPPPPSKSL